MLKRKSKVLGIIFDNEDNVPLDKISEEDHWMIEALNDTDKDLEKAFYCIKKRN